MTYHIIYSLFLYIAAIAIGREIIPSCDFLNAGWQERLQCV